MSTLAHRFGPPALVLGAALYLGWPPASPLDLGEPVVKARAVRWKAADLDPPPASGQIKDPFLQVLVAKNEMEADMEAAKLAVPTKPVGPTAEEIAAGMTLTGIARVGTRRWVIINGKPRMEGDVIKIDNSLRTECKVISIATDHAIVRCGEIDVKIQSRSFGLRTSKPAAAIKNIKMMAPRVPATNQQTPAAPPSMFRADPPRA